MNVTTARDVVVAVLVVVVGQLCRLVYQLSGRVAHLEGERDAQISVRKIKGG